MTPLKYSERKPSEMKFVSRTIPDAKRSGISDTFKNILETQCITSHFVVKISLTYKTGLLILYPLKKKFLSNQKNMDCLIYDLRRHLTETM